MRITSNVVSKRDDDQLKKKVLFEINDLCGMEGYKKMVKDGWCSWHFVWECILCTDLSKKVMYSSSTIYCINMNNENGIG